MATDHTAEMPTLPPRQERFCQEFLKDLNATRAAKDSGYSEKTAKAQASRLMSEPAVQARIQELMKAREERTEITVDRVLQELAIIGFSDIRHFQVDDLGNLTLKEGAPDTAWRAVASVKHRTTTRGSGDDEFTVREVELKLWSKPEGLRMAGEHLGMFKKVVETRDMTLEEALREVEPAVDDGRGSG